MIVLRWLPIFAALVLLGGCTTPCGGPSHPSNSPNCWYKLKVTKIDQGSGWVTGTYTPEIKDREGDPTKQMKFIVRDMDWLLGKNPPLLREGGVYWFNAHGSPFLEAFPEGYEPVDKY